MTLSYSADAPMKVTAVYPLTDGGEVTDIFYLEAGTDRTFDALEVQGGIRQKKISIVKFS